MDFANTPSFFRSGPKPGTRLFLCALASIALLVGDSRYGLMEQARDGMSLVLYPCSVWSTCRWAWCAIW
jgi:rod shape-determining protein MreC